MYAVAQGSFYTYRRGFGWAGLLVMVAVMLVLANLQLLPEGYLAALWPLWPAPLAAIGAQLLGSRFHPWLGSLAALGILAAALGAAWWLASGTPASSFEPLAHRVRVLAGTASSARVELSVGAGELRVSAGKAGGLLIGGTLEADGRETSVRPLVSDRDGQRRVSLSSDGPDGPMAWFGQRPGEIWDLQLRTDIPTELRVDGGATRMTLDLALLAVTRLDVDAGLADTRVVMPESVAETRARFSIGAATLDIEIPDGVAAQIRMAGGLSSVSIDEHRFPLESDGLYRSPDYDTAMNRVDLDISASASRVRIR